MMSEAQWEVVYETNGPLQAEILRGFLEANEIPVVLSQEGLGRVYGLTVGPLGRVQILVPSVKLGQALKMLEEYERGTTGDVELSDQDGQDSDDQSAEFDAS
jgi:hypothetical protein